MTICQAACGKVLRGAPPAIVPSALMSKSASASFAPASLGSCVARSSRHIFQHTHSSSRPPASSRPTICSSCVVTPAKPMRSTVAATMPIRIALARWSCRQARRGEADDDGVVAGQHQVDEDDFEQGRQRVGGEDGFQHDATTLHRCDVRRARVDPCPVETRSRAWRCHASTFRWMRRSTRKARCGESATRATPTGVQSDIAVRGGLPEGPGLEVSDRITTRAGA